MANPWLLRPSCYQPIDQTSAVKVITEPWDQLSKGLINVEIFWTMVEDTLHYKIKDDLRDIWNTFDNCMFPRQEIQITLKNLKASGYTLGLLSDTVPPTAESIRQGGGYDPFEFIVLSCEVRLRKPDERIYNMVLSQIPNIDPQNIVYIDDNPINLVPAQKLGMQTILAGNSKDLNTEIAKITFKKAT